MILQKAEIVSHLDSNGTRQTIYSLDFQPNSRRLATCGGDATVKIWNVDSFSNANDSKEALLATLTTHSKPVNIVRWSRDGRVLASGSDDNYILIHRYSPGGVVYSTFGSSTATAKNKENWVRCCTLQGHNMDVLDLDWAPNGLLASASVDNLIMIWNIGQALLNNRQIISPYRILSGHYSFVKGIAFDPIGQYLVSCGADNLILVWHCEAIEGGKKPEKHQENWSVVKELSTPMKNCADKGMYRRIHWSADGQTVCISSCVKSGKPVGLVLKRDTWETVADLVGHGAPTASCRYCPYILNVLPSNSSLIAPVAHEPEQLVQETSAMEVTNTTDPVKISPDKPEKTEKKRRRSSSGTTYGDNGNEEKRYSTSSADRNKRHAARNLATTEVKIESTDSFEEPTLLDLPAPIVPTKVSSPVRTREVPSVPATPHPTTRSNKNSPIVDISPQAFSSSSVSNTILALGDQAGVLSLWASNDVKPLAVIRGLFEGAVTDIAWMRYGGSEGNGKYSRLFMACCSIDGHLFLFDFTGERFTTYNSTEMESHCRQLYCDIEIDSSSKDIKANAGDQFGVQMNAFMPLSSSVPGSILVGLSGKELIAHQLETITTAKNGKKRIKPVLVVEQAPPSSAADTAGNNTTSSVTTTESIDQEVEWCWNGGALHKTATQASTPSLGKSNISHYHSSTYREPVHLQPSHHLQRTGSRSPENSNDSRKKIRFSDSHQYHLYTPPDSLSSTGSRSNSSGTVINDLSGMIRRKNPSNGTSMPTTIGALRNAYSDQRNGQQSLAPPPPVIINRSLTIQHDDRKTICTIPIQEKSTTLKWSVRSLDSKDSNILLTCVDSTVSLSTKNSEVSVWSNTILCDNITVMSGFATGTGNEISGVGCVGDAEGSLVIFSLSSGQPYLPPLLLGASIVFSDVVQRESVARILAATALGDVFVWHAAVADGEFSLRSVIQTSLRSIVFSTQIQLKIIPLRSDKKLDVNTEEDKVIVDKCYLNEEGLLLAAVKAEKMGDNKMFAFREDAQVWCKHST